MGVLKNIANKMKKTGERTGFDPLSSKVARGALRVADPVSVGVGKAAKLGLGMAGNMASGHWNESGLGNLFGPLKGWTKNADGLFKKKKKRKNIKSKGGLGSGKSAAVLKSIAESLKDIKSLESGNNAELKKINSGLDKLENTTSDGFNDLYQILSRMEETKKNPFEDVVNRRKKIDKPKLPSVIPSKKKNGGILGTLMSGLASLFGKNGLLGSGLSGIVGIAKSLLNVVKSLTKAGGSLLKFAGSIGAALAVGLGKTVAAVGRSIGRAGKAAAKRVKGNPKAKAPKPSVPLLEPPRPALEPPKPKPVEPETHKPRSTVTEPETPKPRKLTAAEEAEKARINRPLNDNVEPKAKATATPTERALNNADDALKKAEAKAPTVQAKPTAEAPKPTVEAPKPVEPVKPKPTETPSGAKASTVLKEGVEEAVKDAPKAVAKGGLKGALSKMFGGVAAGILEGVTGFIDWADAYDKFMDGKMPEQEYKKIQSEVIGKAMGGVAGGALGAALGGTLGLAAGPAAVVASPVLGILGGIGGAMYGGEIGKQGGEAFFKVMQKERTGKPQVEGQQSPPVNRAPPITASPNVTAPAERMNQGTERQQAQNKGGNTIVNAPTTNNTTNNNGGGSGGGSGSTSPGSARPGTSGLDREVLGDNVRRMP